jgi:xanthine dehydrogenase FAD-binding subunit
MAKGLEPMFVHKPRSLREAFALLKERPGARFIAGGTDWLRRRGEGESPPPGDLVSLSEVDELTRIRRRETSVEIGAAVSLERIISLGGNFVPTLLIRVLERIASQAVRNLATLGGNIVLASPDSSDAILPLLLLDARCELRRPAAHSWAPLARFLKGPGRTALAPLEILTAVSLPLPRWNVRMYEKLDRNPGFAPARFAALASVSKATVTDFRLIWGGADPLALRSRELEALVIGAKTPFSPKLESLFAERAAALVEAAPPSFLPEPYLRRTAVRLARAFLSKVGAYREAWIPKRVY